MPRPRETVWQMSEEQRKLFPDVSGNDINGLGETESRQPSIVYWPNNLAFDTIPHGELCGFMLEHLSPEVMAVLQDAENRGPEVLDPVAETRVEDTPENWTTRVKEFALGHEADLLGITRLNPDWFFESCEPPDLPWVVMIAGKMHYEKVNDVLPSMEDPSAMVMESALVYNQVNRATGALANWIRSQGYHAEMQGGPFSGEMQLIPPAIECGLGEFGKHGSLINRELGALLKLAAVRTDMPLVPDEPDIFGADEFCMSCRVCADACPPDAMHDDKRMVRGDVKWYVDFDECVAYFNEKQACGLCLAVCPWSRPGIAPNLLIKMARRRRNRVVEEAGVS